MSKRFSTLYLSHSFFFLGSMYGLCFICKRKRIYYPNHLILLHNSLSFPKVETWGKSHNFFLRRWSWRVGGGMMVIFIVHRFHPFLQDRFFQPFSRFLPQGTMAQDIGWSIDWRERCPEAKSRFPFNTHRSLDTYWAIAWRDFGRKDECRKVILYGKIYLDILQVNCV